MHIKLVSKPLESSENISEKIERYFWRYFYYSNIVKLDPKTLAPGKVSFYDAAAIKMLQVSKCFMQNYDADDQTMNIKDLWNYACIKQHAHFSKITTEDHVEEIIALYAEYRDLYGDIINNPEEAKYIMGQEQDNTTER